MDHYLIIADNFQETIEAVSLAADTLAEGIEQGSGLMAQALLADNKIIACGNGVDAALAQLFTCNLLDRFDAERPALPALTLGTDHPSFSAMARASGIGDALSRQLSALGQAGDVLVCFNSSGSADHLSPVMRTATERNIGVILLSHSEDAEYAEALGKLDVLIQVGAIRQARLVELYTMVIHGFCEMIDHNLFGTHNQE
jgi:phosphoheptose isomerase